MANSTDSRLVHPFRPGDQFTLPVPGIEYHPDHPLMRQMSDACTKGELDEIKKLVRQWLDAPDASLPRGPSQYPIGTLEPLWYQAIREDHADIVDYLLGQGIKMCQLGLWDAIAHNCSASMWQVFLDHGLDINESVDGAGPGPLAFVPWPFLSTLRPSLRSVFCCADNFFLGMCSVTRALSDGFSPTVQTRTSSRGSG